MTIIFDPAVRPIKPRRPFALGLARPNCVRVAPFTQADREWAAAHLNASATDYAVEGPADFILDQLAGASAYLDSISA